MRNYELVESRKKWKQPQSCITSLVVLPLITSHFVGKETKSWLHCFFCGHVTVKLTPSLTMKLGICNQTLFTVLEPCHMDKEVKADLAS